ncbi:uncharacterized protein [Nicotiana sylvestris]|uniref:uncharacterized protein n=1 Tax=Nicotiana sylvestris TaxID=4096 RepID=UPI00388CB499
MDEEDAEKTAFITPWGTYCYRVMPFGLKNTGATYMRAMTTIFHDMIHKEIKVYVDDIIIKSIKQSDHVRDLRKFFQRLRRYNLKLNPAKCAFGVPSGKLLGFIVSRRAMPPKTTATSTSQKAMKEIEREISYTTDSNPSEIVGSIEEDPSKDLYELSVRAVSTTPAVDAKVSCIWFCRVRIQDIEVESSTIQSIPMVNEFPDVFPDELPAFLGHIISGKDIRVDTQETEAVKILPRPTTLMKDTGTSSLVTEVKECQYEDLVLVHYRDTTLQKEKTPFEITGDGILRYQGQLCMPNVTGLRRQVVKETHYSCYSIYLGATKMYHDIREVYWWNGMKKDIAEFVAQCPNYQQKCRSPIGWFDVGETMLVGPELVQQAIERIKLIQERLLTAQSRQKAYADN